MARAAVLFLSLSLGLPAGASQAPQTAAPGSSPAPQIQNGRVEVRRGTSIDKEIAAAVPASAVDPVWVAWRAPMIDGDRDLCSWYSDRLGTTRGMFIDDGVSHFSSTVTNDGVTYYSNYSGPQGEPSRPQITQPKGPIPLEAGTGVVTLVRVVGGRVERLRTVGDDCPMDAGGRTVYWLDAVTPAESLRYLATLAEAGPSDRSPRDLDRRVAESAVKAMGYHRDPAADAALDRIATNHRDSGIRRQAASTMASHRGAAGVSAVLRLLNASKDTNERQQLTSALGSSHDASAVAAFRGLAKDPDPKVRAEAAYYLVIRGGAAVIPEALKIIESESVDAVRTRAVSAIGRLPSDTGVPHLIQIARSSTSSLAVKKEAASALSRSKDPRAVAFMEEIINRW
jgi:hypothetical protein